MNDEELTKSLSSETEVMFGRCQLEIENATPSGWGVVIAAAGANFYYQDGTSETDGPRPINLQSGGRASFYSKLDSGCVKRIYAVLKVVIPGQGAQDMVDNISDVPPDMCMRYRGIRLAPKSNIPESQRKSKNVSDCLEIQYY